MSSNVGKWDRWYEGVTLDTPQTYGDETTYRMGAEWLRGSNIVYDWGCGKGGFVFVASGMMKDWPLLDTFPVLGIDGSKTPFAEITADLTEFKVNLDVFSEDFKASVFMRHVLEHDWKWEQILRNAAASFNYRMFLVLFTPLQEETTEIAWNEDPGVPDIGFNPQDVLRVIGETVRANGRDGMMHIQTDVKTRTQYGSETTIAVELYDEPA